MPGHPHNYNNISQNLSSVRPGWETWTMFEPTGIKQNAQPHSYTLTSKKSLVFPDKQ